MATSGVTEEFDRAMAEEQVEEYEGIEEMTPTMPAMGAVPAAAAPSTVDGMKGKLDGMMKMVMKDGKCGLYAAAAFLILSTEPVVNAVKQVFEKLNIPGEGMVNLVARAVVCGLIVVVLQKLVK